ncbi:MAG: cytochrome c [Nitrospirales bacterium]|nr:cytochrome c [Nitrospirales bacterium]
MRVWLSGSLAFMCWSGVVFADSHPANIETGGSVYRTNCVSCHGMKGRGDGPVAVHLTPPPADLTSQTVKQKNDQDLLKTIREGKPGTSMPAWKSGLSDQQMEDVLAYIRTFGE